MLYHFALDAQQQQILDALADYLPQFACTLVAFGAARWVVWPFLLVCWRMLTATLSLLTRPFRTPAGDGLVEEILQTLRQHHVGVLDKDGKGHASLRVEGLVFGLEIDTVGEVVVVDLLAGTTDVWPTLSERERHRIRKQLSQTLASIADRDYAAARAHALASVRREKVNSLLPKSVQTADLRKFSPRTATEAGYMRDLREFLYQQITSTDTKSCSGSST